MFDRHSVPGKVAVAWPPETWRDVTVLAAVSGGADSVALLRALQAVRGQGTGRIVVAHFNHRLRGAESDADQQFVVELARQLGLFVMVESAAQDLAASCGGRSLEGAARQARYDFLADAANRAGARYVATGHTADDQVETVLHNLLRGTGLAGLAGIPRRRQLAGGATIVRPLLAATRANVLSYLAQIEQSYRDDASNATAEFTRNRLRHELLPLLERDYNPHVRAALLRLSQIAGDANDELTRQADTALEARTRRVEGGIELDIAALNSASEFFVRTVLMAAWRSQGWPLQDMSYDKWMELAALATPAVGNSPSQTLPGGIRAERRGAVLRLTRPAPQPPNSTHSIGAS